MPLYPTRKLIYVLLLVAAMFGKSLGQTITLIDPNGDGGFETASTFSGNGWNTVSSSTNYWRVGALSSYSGARGAYISNSSSTISYTTTTATASHLYRDIFVPAGASAITLSFRYKGNGESGYDRLLVYYSSTIITPAAYSPASPSTSSSATLLYTQLGLVTSYTSATCSLPSSVAGTYVRIIFTWQNDNSLGSQPPVSLDNISLTCNCPTVSSIGGLFSLCQGSSTTLSNLVSGGSWSSSNASVAYVNSSTGVVTGNSLGTATISYNNGCSYAVQTVSVNPIPSVSVSPTSTSSCVGGNTYFSSSVSAGATSNILTESFDGLAPGWTISNTAGSSSSYWQLRLPPAYGVSGDGTKFFEAAPYVSSPTTTILRSPAFSTVGYTSVSISLNQFYQYYSGDITAAIQYSTNGATWYNLANYLNSVGSSTWVSSSPTTILTLPSSALGQSTVYIRFNYSSNYGYYWAIDNFKITGVPTGASGIFYSWTGSSGTTGISCASCASTTITPTYSGPQAYSLTVTSFGCTTTKVVTVNVNPSPAPISGAVITCVGATTTMSTTTFGGTWSSSSPAIASVNNSGIVSAVSNGVVNISYTNSPGCYVTKALTVNSSPNAITGNNTTCIGTPNTLTASSPGGYWANSNSAVGSISTSGIFYGTLAGTTTITYTLPSGCFTTFLMNVTDFPTYTYSPSDTSLSLCHGSCPTLFVVGPGGASFEWTRNNVSLPGSTNSSFYPTTAGTYAVIANSGSCMKTIATWSVNDQPAPMITFLEPLQYLYTDVFSTYQWYLNGLPIDGANTNLCFVSSNGLYQVVTTDENMCTDTAAYDCQQAANVIDNEIDNHYCYPNPAHNYLLISGSTTARLSIIDIFGKTLLQDMGSRMVNIEQLTSGTYIVILFDDRGAVIHKQTITKQ